MRAAVDCFKYRYGEYRYLCLHPLEAHLLTLLTLPRCPYHILPPYIHLMAHRFAPCATMRRHIMTRLFTPCATMRRRTSPYTDMLEVGRVTNPDTRFPPRNTTTATWNRAHFGKLINSQATTLLLCGPFPANLVPDHTLSDHLRSPPPSLTTPSHHPLSHTPLSPLSPLPLTSLPKAPGALSPPP
jgi:hypothetical protein